MCQSVVNVCHGRRTGKLVEKSDIDQFCFSVRNMDSAHNQFPAITQTKRMVDRTGKPVEEITGIAEEGKALVHRLGLCSMNKDERSSQNDARKFLITNSKQLEQNKNAKFYKKNYGVNNRIFVKFINKILPRWRNYENCRVLPSIRSPDRSSSRIRTLLWNYLEDYKNCKMK